MSFLAIIGGTGLTQMPDMKINEQKQIITPYGAPSAEFVIGEINSKKIVFLSRHGNPHRIPPHKINYRANIWGLKQLKVDKIIAVAAVGGITNEMYPGRLIIPNQLIDYTYGRKNTFFEDEQQSVSHIDFTNPYSEKLRSLLINAATNQGINVYTQGIYGATQGPRLETAAEIRRMQRDGCDLVGMTGMPETALARELNLDYATCAVVANWAAGKTAGTIDMHEIEHNLKYAMQNISALISKLLQN